MQKQGGFLLPVAMFIIVAMGLASLALWRTTAQTSTASVQELLSTQAFYTAESGLQAGLSELFYPDASSESVVNNQCLSMGTLTLSFEGIDGLNLCEVSVSCQCLDQDNGLCTSESRGSVYKLESVGSCGSGITSAKRTLELTASMGAGL